MSTTQTAARTRGVLLVTCLSTLVVNANTSAVSILLPAISNDTGMDVTTLQWAVTGYSFVRADRTLRLGRHGHRRALHPGRFGCDDPRVWAELAHGGHSRGRQAPGGLALGGGGGRGRRRGTIARWCLGRADNLAGIVLGGRGRRGAVHGDDGNQGE